jgi:hypothetical protein
MLMRAWKLGMFMVFSIFILSGLAFADKSWTPADGNQCDTACRKVQNSPSQLVAQQVPIKASSAQRKEQQAQMSPVCAPDLQPNPTVWDAQSTARTARP